LKDRGPAHRITDDLEHHRLRAEELQDRLRTMIRMQLVRILAAWRRDLTAYRDVEAAYRISIAEPTSRVQKHQNHLPTKGRPHTAKILLKEELWRMAPAFPPAASVSQFAGTPSLQMKSVPSSRNIV
jgi:hypothetical protein